MIVLTATHKALQSNNDPYIGLMLAISLVGILIFCVVMFIKNKMNGE